MQVQGDMLLSLVKKYKKHVWIGFNSPFTMERVDLLNSTGFRLSPSYHQNYEVVWYYENDFSHLSPYSWKIVLDEMIRLVGSKGFLVIRTRENHHITIPLIKNFLGRRYGLSTFIEYENISESMEFTIIFRLNRGYIENYQSDLWTFAILTSGKKDSNVIQFLESVRRYDKDNKHEIIISGSPKASYDKYGVKYLDLSQFRDSEYPEIAKKKNAIANIAKHPNLLIAHDRYKLSNNFFKGFDKYGYDFDFITIQQFYESGEEYPAYCIAPHPFLTWKKPIHCLNINHLFDAQYINGGLMIFKKHVIGSMGFNDLLFWNQMEDVELTKSLINANIPPRINFFSHAMTIGIDSSKTKDFVQYPKNYKLNPSPWDEPYVEKKQNKPLYKKVFRELKSLLKKLV